VEIAFVAVSTFEILKNKTKTIWIRLRTRELS